VNVDLQKDIWSKGFGALAAAGAGGGAAGAGAAAGAASRSKAVLEYSQYSLLLTEPLFNFEPVRNTTEEVGARVREGLTQRHAVHTTRARACMRRACPARTGRV
jgi:hypothetical protein